MMSIHKKVRLISDQNINILKNNNNNDNDDSKKNNSNDYVIYDETMYKMSITSNAPNNKKLTLEKTSDSATILLECNEDLDSEMIDSEVQVISTKPQDLELNDLIVPLNQIMDWECCDDIMQTMLLRQQYFHPDAEYMNRQDHIDPRMRAMLFDWMMHVSSEFALGRETTHLAFTYVDRTLSRIDNIETKYIQLIGTACLMIAAKLDETLPPTVYDFASTTNQAYTTHDIFNMERRVLQILSWELLSHTPYSFMKLFTKLAARYVIEHHQTITTGERVRKRRLLKQLLSHKNFHSRMELLDVCIMDVNNLHFLPSKLAVACLLFAVPDLKSIAYEATGYSYESVSECVGYIRYFADIPSTEPLTYGRVHLKTKLPEEDLYTRQTFNPDSLAFFQHVSENYMNI